MIKNIIFDIGNVLVSFAWKETMEELGFTPECIDILDKGFINNSLWDELDLGVKAENDVIETACKAFPQYSQNIKLFWENNLMSIRPYDYSEAWLKDLKNRGYNVYLLTNYPDTLFKKSVENAFPFYSYTDGEIVSSRVKIRKPDKKIYEALFSKYNLRPEESIFFDDRAVNIDGAKAVGLNAFLFETFEKAENTIKDFGGR